MSSSFGNSRAVRFVQLLHVVSCNAEEPLPLAMAQPVTASSWIYDLLFTYLFIYLYSLPSKTEGEKLWLGSAEKDSTKLIIYSFIEWLQSHRGTIPCKNLQK